MMNFEGADLDIELREFIAAMVRLGTTVFCREPSVAASTERLIAEHLRPFALLSEGADALSEALGSTVVQVCIKNDDLCIQNDGFCIQNDEFCIKNDGFCIENYDRERSTR